MNTQEIESYIREIESWEFDGDSIIGRGQPTFEEFIVQIAGGHCFVGGTRFDAGSDEYLCVFEAFVRSFSHMAKARALNFSSPIH